MYSNYYFPSPNSSQILLNFPPPQVHALSFYPSLENRHLKNIDKIPINQTETNRQKKISKEKEQELYIDTGTHVCTKRNPMKHNTRNDNVYPKDM